MRVILMGAPAFSVPTLQALLGAGHDVVAVVTQPDRPAGRGHATRPPPLKTAALEHGLNVLQPGNVSDPAFVETLADLQADVVVVAAYGQILRRNVLELAPHGCLNVHASLLPRHRGASPVAAAILAGDGVTGVTIIKLVRALDAGPMLARTEIPILASDTTGSLEERLAVAGAGLLVGCLEDWVQGRLEAQPQDEALATYAPQIKREEALIDWTLPAVDLWRRVRAYNPWPVAYTSWRGQELRLLEAWPVEDGPAAPPGTVLTQARLPAEAGATGEAVPVQTGHGALALLRLQLAGRRPMSGLEFARGQREFIGSRLGG